ncbi:MAG: alkaline phosphatase family protein [Anaerolineae bacterium]|nr:alkaline phosphatase family protein [Anaerolineae bacterium]
MLLVIVDRGSALQFVVLHMEVSTYPMLNEQSIAAVNASVFAANPTWGKPLYDSYCFSRIPQTVLHTLTGEGDPGLPTDVLGDLPKRYEKVLLIWVDAFGWRFFERYADRYPFLKRFLEQDNAVVSKLTTQFPSTTAAHSTTMHSGVPVGISGVYEWYYYEPLLERVICPLMYNFMGDKERNTLKNAGITPQQLFPNRSIYTDLGVYGIPSVITSHREYTPSPFGEVVCKGAKLRPIRTLADSLIECSDAILNSKEKGYFFLYIDSIDSIGHARGPSSPHFDAEVDVVFTALDRLLYSALKGQVKDTLLLLTADHGQMEVTPQRLINLKTEIPQLESMAKRNSKNQMILLAGSPRDVFLHIKPERLDEAEALIKQAVEGRAEVHRTARLIDDGLFGAVSDVFRSRVGDLVVLSYDQEQAWWQNPNDPVSDFRGHHGGLTRAEMETHLLAMAL